MAMIDYMIRYWALYYFVPPLVILFALLSFIKLSLDPSVKGVRRSFRWYTAGIFLLLVITNSLTPAYGLVLADKIVIARIWELSNFIFGAIEAYVLLGFLTEIVDSPVIKSRIKYVLILLLTANPITAFFIFQTQDLDEIPLISSTFCAISLTFILVCYLQYFFETYQANRKFNRQVILIVFSVTAYTALSIPCLIVSVSLHYTYLKLFRIIYVIHYINVMALCLLMAFNSNKIQKRKIVLADEDDV
jgi:hypothetical protein